MQRRAMPRRGTVHLLLLVLVVSAWGFGLYESLRVRRHQIHLGCVPPDFFAPYDTLRPHLDESSRAVFVGYGQPDISYFRAQYAVTPKVLSYSPVEFAIRRIAGERPVDATLILGLEEETRDRLASEARQQGLTVSVANIGPGLTLMRVREP